jgi:hypothetical protein
MGWWRGGGCEGSNVQMEGLEIFGLEGLMGSHVIRRREGWQVM